MVVSGAGPATALRATQTEAALIVQNCSQVEIRHVRIEGGSPSKGDPQLNGALTVVASTQVTGSGALAWLRSQRLDGRRHASRSAPAAAATPTRSASSETG